MTKVLGSGSNFGVGGERGSAQLVFGFNSKCRLGNSRIKQRQHQKLHQQHTKQAAR
jgi:hypothetical protein